MSVFLQPGAKKRVYWYRFMYRGELVRRSTKQGNYKAAVDMEAAHKTALAKGDVGIFEKESAPTLAAFSKEFLAWAKSRFREKPKTLEFYDNGIARLLEFQGLASLRLDDSSLKEHVDEYIVRRQAPSPRCPNGLAVSSINRELQVLRRLLHLAAERKKIEAAPKITLLPGERHREHVLSPEEMARYLAAAREPLASVATVLADTGMRPEECYRLRWESITWVNGRHGTLLVTHGKTKAARRVLPMTPKVRTVLEARWIAAESPVEGWVWPSETRSGHIEPSTLRKAHRAAVKMAKIRPFVLYALRHSFLTRLGTSGVDAWTLARIAGHNSIDISQRYVHPSNDLVLAALDRPEFSHGHQTEDSEPSEERALSA